MSLPELPHHRYEIVWKVGAHSLEDFQRKIASLGDDISIYGIRNFVSSHTGIFVVSEDEEMTEAQYRGDLESYIQARNDQKRAQQEVNSG